MERVQNNKEWSLFCPNEAPGLSDCWGEEFNKLYTKYEKEVSLHSYILMINSYSLDWLTEYSYLSSLYRSKFRAKTGRLSQRKACGLRF